MVSFHPGEKNQAAPGQDAGQAGALDPALRQREDRPKVSSPAHWTCQRVPYRATGQCRCVLNEGLKWSDYPALPWWAQRNHRDLPRGRQEGRDQDGVRWKQRQESCGATGQTSKFSQEARKCKRELLCWSLQTDTPPGLLAATQTGRRNLQEHRHCEPPHGPTSCCASHSLTAPGVTRSTISSLIRAETPPFWTRSPAAKSLL